MESLERIYTQLLVGDDMLDDMVSPLLTDGYKFPMGQAGFPLRQETFYLHFRKGGPQKIPFDFRDVVQCHLRPRNPTTREQGFLLANGYGLTPAMETALSGALRVWAMPKGSWVNEQEPVMTITGPSFLVSWLEPLVIAFNFPIQVATAITKGCREFTACCETEARIIDLVANALDETVTIHTDGETYQASLSHRLVKIRSALAGDISRAFEVGMRGMTCLEQHRIALEACRSAGINRTSNVKSAYDLYLIPVGTTGHEHQQRHGRDINGFRAIRDCRPEPPSYLFDTYDPINLGIPAAIEVMREDLYRLCSVRFDSGDQEYQLWEFVAAEKEYGIRPNYLFMDGYNPERILAMEAMATSLKIAPHRRHYGLGGYLSAGTSGLTRDNLAMVYKLCQTGGPGPGARPVQKYSGGGKASLPGIPVVMVSSNGTRWIAQAGEQPILAPTAVWIPAEEAPFPSSHSKLSPQTEYLHDQVRQRDLGVWAQPGLSQA